MNEQSTTAAKPAGTCYRCGGQLYEYLVHHCGTAIIGPTSTTGISDAAKEENQERESQVRETANAVVMEAGDSRCGHRSPLNYDRTKWAVCTRPAGHTGDHEEGNAFRWTDKTMPSAARETPQSGVEVEDGEGNLNLGAIEIRRDYDGAPDDVVAPWKVEGAVVVHVERMDDDAVWMEIRDDRSGASSTFWFRALKGRKLAWTLTDYNDPTSTTNAERSPDSDSAPAPVCVRCVRLEEALRAWIAWYDDAGGSLELDATLALSRAALATVGEDEKPGAGDGSAVVVEALRALWFTPGPPSLVQGVVKAVLGEYDSSWLDGPSADEIFGKGTRE